MHCHVAIWRRFEWVHFDKVLLKSWLQCWMLLRLNSTVRFQFQSRKNRYRHQHYDWRRMRFPRGSGLHPGSLLRRLPRRVDKFYHRNWWCSFLQYQFEMEKQNKRNGPHHHWPALSPKDRSLSFQSQIERVVILECHTKGWKTFVLILAKEQPKHWIRLDLNKAGWPHPWWTVRA